MSGSRQDDCGLFLALLALGWSVSEAASAPALVASPGPLTSRRIGISSGAYRRSVVSWRSTALRRGVR